MEKYEQWNVEQFVRQGMGCHPGVTVSKAALKELFEAAEFALMTLDHAMFLGHLGEGSTHGMASDATNKLRKAGITNPGDDNE